MVGDAGVALLENNGSYDLNENYLVIDANNVEQFNGKTITGNYCPTNRPESTYTDIKGGIIIDNVTVDLTIKDVTIQSDGASGWNLAGIYLKGNAQLNLTLEGTNTLVGLDDGAGIEVEKGATLVITENSTGSLKAVGGAYGAAGIGGSAGSTGYEGRKLETGTIIIKGGSIVAEGGAYQVSQSMRYHGGAGIGTGLYGIGGTIEILGGRITAAGGRETGAGIGGGAGGSVDKIVIGGARGKAPDITVSSYNNGESGYLGAAIGSGWNGVTGLKLSCGDIRILSGSVKVKGGNIGYGVLKPLPGNSMKGGSVTISEEVQLELPLESKIEPRGDCTYGKKTFRITAGHSTVDPRVLREDLVSGNVFVLDILQVHLTAVDRCRAVQLSNQTADISITDNSGVGQTDIFQFAAKGLEQARIAGVPAGIRTLFCLNGQITDLRMIYPASAVIAFELSVFDWCKFSVGIQLTPAIAFIALELDIPLLHRGGDCERFFVVFSV